MSINSLLYTGRDAIQAQTYGVTVTGQNINNANTPGYVRRDPLLSTRVLGNETYGSVGVDGLRRATDAFLEQRHYSAVGMSASATTRDQQLAQLEAVFNDLAGAGMGDALDRMASAFQQLSVDPSDSIARGEVLSSLSDFVSTSHETGDALASQRTEVLNQMQNLVTKVNEDAKSLAALNTQIQNAVVQGHDAADLKDKRNQILLELSPIIDVRVVEEDDGNALIQVAGATLVEGGTARQLLIDLDTNGDVRLQATRPDGTGATNITAGLSGGQLAGLKEVRDTDIKSVMNRVDTFVYDVATALNTQHQAGFALDGSTGLELFDLSGVTSPPAGAARSIALSAQVAGQPERIAASGSLAELPGSGVNATLLTSVFDQAIAFGGSRSASEAYSDIIGEVGVRRADASREVSLRDAMKTQFYELRESSMGVSLDEEMIALTRYQRAYQAASKVITTADELLQELLTIKR